MAEMTSIEGIVKVLKKDKKGVQLEDGQWYGNTFLKEELNCNKGDKVSITLNPKGYMLDLKVVSKGQTIGQEMRAEKSEEQSKSKQASVVMSYATDLAVAGKIKVTEIAEYAKSFMALHAELVSGKPDTKVSDTQILKRIPMEEINEEDLL